MAISEADRLTCGALVDDLLAQVTDDDAPRAPAHQAGCPTCQATLAELSALWAPVRAIASEQVLAPAGLLSSVMARIRELSRNTWHAVIHSDQGQTRIAARVIAAIARLAAEDVPHVTLALGGGRTAQGHTAQEVAGPDVEAATDVGVAGTHVVIDVQVAVEWGAHIPQLADQIRDQITRHIAAHTSLRTDQVNIAIVDVQAPRT